MVSKALEYSPRDPDHAAVLADLDPELHGLPLGIPAGVLGERWLGNDAARAILLTGAANEERHLGRVKRDDRSEERSISSPT